MLMSASHNTTITTAILMTVSSVKLGPLIPPQVSDPT